MGENTWLSPQEARCMRLGCREFGCVILMGAEDLPKKVSVPPGGIK